MSIPEGLPANITTLVSELQACVATQASAKTRKTAADDEQQAATSALQAAEQDHVSKKAELLSAWDDYTAKTRSELDQIDVVSTDPTPA